jgi:uncharacterized protein
MNTQTNKQTVERIYAALETGDRTVFGDAVSPDYSWRLAGCSTWSRKFEGQESVRRDLLSPLFARFATNYTARLLRAVGDGDIVIAEVVGDVMTTDDTRYNNEYCFVFRFENGLIVEITEYCDTDLIERVLGSYPKAAEAVT